MPHSRDEIVGALKDLLRRQQRIKLPVESITEATPLADLGFDSLSLLEFMYDVEGRFQIQAGPEELARLERVGDLIHYLEARLAR
jgi:acyl carrier protein